MASPESRLPENQFGFELTATAAEVRAHVEGSLGTNEVMPPANFAVAGRILALRDQGKIMFGDLHDETGAIQIVAERDDTPAFDELVKTSHGDWLGITGLAGKTRRGEPSIFVTDWVTLAKTELPFPDKTAGVLDPETKTRQRYLDLATNPVSRQRFKDRSRIVSLVRQQLEGQGFMEVETPILQTLYGGAAARPFQTHHNTLDTEMYLRIAPELYLKRLVVGGLTRVFEIGKDFRNEGISPRHNPEFTMMEVYAAYWDGERQMKLTEDLVSSIAQELHGDTTISYQGREVDLKAPWPRVTMDALVSSTIGEQIDLDTPISKLKALCEQFGIPVESSYGPGKLMLELYEKLVEDDLWGPIFVTDYPKEVSPLAREHRSRPGYTERFEGIVAGSELCNGFTELNDAEEQYHRFRDQERASEHDDEAMQMDYDYVRALKYGLPPTGGLGIGIDRLAMLMTNAASIKDVILFPTLKPDGYTTSY